MGGWLCFQSDANPSPRRVPCYQGKYQGILSERGIPPLRPGKFLAAVQGVRRKFPKIGTGNFFVGSGNVPMLTGISARDNRALIGIEASNRLDDLTALELDALLTGVSLDACASALAGCLPE
jgi:hypothetical protein